MNEITGAIILVLCMIIAFIIGTNWKEWKQFKYDEYNTYIRWCKFCGQQQRYVNHSKNWIEFHINKETYKENCGCHQYAKR